LYWKVLHRAYHWAEFDCFLSTGRDRAPFSMIPSRLDRSSYFCQKTVSIKIWLLKSVKIFYCELMTNIRFILNSRQRNNIFINMQLNEWNPKHLLLFQSKSKLFAKKTSNSNAYQQDSFLKSRMYFILFNPFITSQGVYNLAQVNSVIVNKNCLQEVYFAWTTFNGENRYASNVFPFIFLFLCFF